MALSTRIAVTLLALAASSAALAQDPSDEGPAQNPFLDLPLVDLGESFSDMEFGFEMRLPKGFRTHPDLEAIRRAQIVPESERLGPDGTPNKIQLYLFQDEIGGSIVIRAHDPALRIENPAQLLATISEADQQAGNPTKQVGKLRRFKMRGGDVGFFAEREFGYAPTGRTTTHRQYIAYMRVGSRSLLVQFSAPLASFESLAKPFKASLGSFILREGRPVEAATLVEARRWQGFFNASVMINLGVAVVLIALFFLLLPRLRSASA